eukprot:4666574-Pyramimonas_sp.AAC.1
MRAQVLGIASQAQRRHVVTLDRKTRRRMSVSSGDGLPGSTSPRAGVRTHVQGMASLAQSEGSADLSSS